MNYPKITCVVIGVNVQKIIRQSLEAVKKSDYPGALEIIYVDGGSTDKSVATARGVEGVKILELNLERPTPGKGRNEGWRAASNDWIQFLDGDTLVDPLWLRKAAESIDEKTAVIFGRRREIFPEKNLYHLVTEIEWPIISERFIGGDMLCRKKALEETGGYDNSLVGGADPELGVRIRSLGWKIKELKEPMCVHDIDINSFSRYWRRSVRVGHAYIEAGLRMLKNGERAWMMIALKIALKAFLVLGLLVCGISLREHILFLGLALAVNFFPIIEINKFKKQFGISFREAFIYALHCSIVVWPQFLGILSYFLKMNVSIAKK